MRNIFTIAGKELRAYFASPIAYVVIGFFSLIFGYFFYTLLWYFDRQSMQVAPGSGMTMNVNQMLIGPVFMNVSVIVLFVMPMGSIPDPLAAGWKGEKVCELLQEMRCCVLSAARFRRGAAMKFIIMRRITVMSFRAPKCASPTRPGRARSKRKTAIRGRARASTGMRR